MHGAERHRNLPGTRRVTSMKAGQQAHKVTRRYTPASYPAHTHPATTV